MKIVGFYTTNTPYEQEYLQLKETMDHYGLSYHFYPIDNTGKWESNCAMKSKVLLQALDDFNDNILYLDSDARILQQPPFEQIEKDVPGICVWHPKYRRNGETLSGTIYFPNNDVSRALIKEWIAEQQKNTNEWDQRVLERIYKKHPHYLMSHDWINIVGLADGTYLLKTDNPIILHTQASRKNKDKV